MKKILLLTSMIAIASCTKQAQPTPSPASVTPPTTGVMSHEDSTMVGDWILDKDEVYSNGNLLQTTPHSDPVNCHLNLLATYVNTSSTLDYKNGISGLTCSQYNMPWRITTGQLDLSGNGLYNILTISSTNLVIQKGSLTTGTALKYYLHK